ncbi:putative quinol monooxygenase [Vibrio hannami]|uniref:putative quinol monooxygenase n=1 Tax=Vibrio hannami TaxID=2717094 RepID=UPI00240F6243|nr:putative quinol monooxygenase [Vibrio hannami]MDG3086526.1 putative quinol monooxygenase [Vibrio hannami]
MLVITVSAIIKPEFKEVFLTHMKSLAATIREESGCVNFEQNFSIDDPNKLFIYEEWASIELFKAHMVTEHMQAHFAKVTPWVESIEMKSLEAEEISGLME